MFVCAVNNKEACIRCGEILNKFIIGKAIS